jgi:hypothetical protein
MHRDALRTVRENDSQITGPACGARPERQCEQEQVFAVGRCSLILCLGSRVPRKRRRVMEHLEGQES